MVIVPSYMEFHLFLGGGGVITLYFIQYHNEIKRVKMYNKNSYS